MKDIFLQVKDRAKEITSIRLIDLEKGQMNYERPPVVFPCILVDIQYPKTQNLNHVIQHVQARIVLRVCFDFTGNTSSDTPDEVLQQSLDYLDVVESVYKKFQGWRNSELNPFTRSSCVPEKRNDAYKVVPIVFNTEFHDRSAADQ